MNDDPVLAEVTRSGVVESVHRGRVAALDAAGRLAVARGAVDTPVLLRSCAKPLQTVAMVRAGLDVDGAGLAIACASHDGTVRHVAVVRAVLDRAGLDPPALQNAAGLPLEPRAHARQLIGDGPDRLHHNCPMAGCGRVSRWSWRRCGRSASRVARSPPWPRCPCWAVVGRSVRSAPSCS